MPSLQHYGVKGMKWGVRRYQNKDGTLTSLGKNHSKVMRTRNEIQELVDTLSVKDRNLMGGEKGTEYTTDEEVHEVMKRFVKKVGKTPVAFLDLYKGAEGEGSITIATRSGSKYRSKGYASDLVKQAQNWLDSDEAKKSMNISTLNWFAYRDNPASIALAKKMGFAEWDGYYKRFNETNPQWWGGRYKRS